MDKAADADGVWCLGWPKEQTLLRWDEIASLKARPQLQRLDVLDGYGRTRLNVDYQLLGFERLRAMLHERLIAASQPGTGQRYSKGVSHHLFYLGAVLALPFFGMLPGACGVEETPFIAHVFAAGMSAWCVYEYARTPLGVRVGEASVTLFYPLRRRTIPFADVTGIEMADTFHERKRFTKVLIRTLDRSKGFRVPRMGVGTSTLYMELRRAWQAQPA